MPVKKTANSEDEFFKDALAGYIKWKAIADKVKQAGKSPEKEVQYAEAYRLLLNKFSE